jgi:hypothetical protein
MKRIILDASARDALHTYAYVRSWHCLSVCSTQPEAEAMRLCQHITEKVPLYTCTRCDLNIYHLWIAVEHIE